ncbi:MAG: GHKL domain-containing protein [Eubacterium coprostanoligenes]|nr:GHKL domain-containing protein [Eubacterium coprostanoligenes]MCI6253854.1 GHKL domain-containing protein [Eubacterium coprostanoligenes]MDY5400940.1 GHKL domain-containing protein [Eubacterium coprostanoligenes]
MCIVIFIYYELLNEQDKKLKEFEKEQQFVELNNSYMQVLESQNNEMHMIVHDVKNHYAAIASMDDANEIHDYISSIANDIQKYQIIKLTNNKMLDLLLSKYKVECSANAVEFNAEVKTANLNYIDDSDLSIVICNLLDNAVQAASKSTAKQISLSLRRVNNFDVLTVTNSCDTVPQSANGKIATSKKDKTSHGYGMRLIEKYARKNNAEYEWHYENDKNIFVSTLIFKR